MNDRPVPYDEYVKGWDHTRTLPKDWTVHDLSKAMGSRDLGALAAYQMAMEPHLIGDYR